jgi:hypothetical protein
MSEDNPAALRRLLLIGALLPDRDAFVLTFGVTDAVTNLPANDLLVRTTTSIVFSRRVRRGNLLAMR